MGIGPDKISKPCFFPEVLLIMGKLIHASDISSFLPSLAGYASCRKISLLTRLCRNTLPLFCPVPVELLLEGEGEGEVPRRLVRAPRGLPDVQLQVAPPAMQVRVAQVALRRVERAAQGRERENEHGSRALEVFDILPFSRTVP